MTMAWKILADWEPLDTGNDEERACFGALGIQANDIWLTEGRDALANRLRKAPLLSGYHLAEWLAWNWWRLRWEPRGANNEWRFSHRMSTIGGGYIWPDITIFSDGERTALIARATRERAETAFRYINSTAVVIPSTDFESGVDDFVDQILGRLESCGVKSTNLSSIWAEVHDERHDPKLSQIRKLEALLGSDPDEADADVVDRLISDASALGETAIEELAADHGNVQVNPVLSAPELAALAKDHGFDMSLPNMVHLPASSFDEDRRSRYPAWLVGARAAQALREQEQLGNDSISDLRLADMLAIDIKAFDHHLAAPVGMSFALDSNAKSSRVVVRSKWHDGRRFELSRLLGDRLLSSEGQLYPATRSFTYRQKAQRSFAAELLCPFNTALNMLQGDYSLEKQGDVAAYFDVSEITVRTQLVNHKILEREDLDSEALATAA